MGIVTLATANVRITHDKHKNLARFVELIDEAASQKANILVLPEVALQGYADFGYTFQQPEFAEWRRYFVRESEPIPGPSTEVIRKAVERHGMYVQLGMAEIALHGNVIYNSTALIGPDGVVGVYRKTHAHPDYPFFNTGESVPVFHTPFGTIGSLICYDIVFPELGRVYALKGAQMLLMSTAWPMKGHDRETDYAGGNMDLMARANAIANQIWLVVSNHCETDAYSTHDDYYGGSQIIDPGGRVLGYLGREEGLVVASVELEDVLWKVRTEEMSACNHLQDRRPELYGAIVDQGYRYPGRVAARYAEPVSENEREPEPAAAHVDRSDGSVT
jgi:predicted amidohydrolase